MVIAICQSNASERWPLPPSPLSLLSNWNQRESSLSLSLSLSLSFILLLSFFSLSKYLSTFSELSLKLSGLTKRSPVYSGALKEKRCLESYFTTM